MANSCFYIGTRQKMLEVRAPSVNMPSSKQGWSSQLNFLNGGTRVRRSKAAAKQYTMTWNSLDRDEARKILDLADGIYGNGNIYWHDPIAADRNVLPQWWASPMQGGYDGLPLNAGLPGRLVATPANTLNLPVESIEYDVTLGRTRSVWIPIPDGYTAWVGAYGQSGTGGRLTATPTTGPTSEGAQQTLALLAVSNNARFTKSYSSSSYDGLQLSLAGSGTITLTGIMVQVIKTGINPGPGMFISGQGNSGCSFVTQPAYTPYSSALDQVGVVAELAETGGWDQ